MDVELIEDDDAGVLDTVRARPRPTAVLRTAGAAVAAVGLVAFGFVAGRSSAPADVARPSSPPEPVATDVPFVETSTGLLLSLDEPVLSSSVTAGAVSLRDAAELWAADQTSALPDADRALLRQRPDRLVVTFDAATGRLSSVRSGDEPEPAITYIRPRSPQAWLNR